MDLGLFGGWSNMVAALIEAVGFYFYAILLLRLVARPPWVSVFDAKVFVRLLEEGAG